MSDNNPKPQVKLEIQQEHKPIIRIDKALAPVKQFSIYKENDALIRDIIIFLANIWQQDLFHFQIFDPVEFSKVMNWNNNNLRRAIKPEEVDPLFPEINTTMGFALLQLYQTHIDVIVDPHNDKWGAWGRGVKKVNVIEELVPSKGSREKKIYKIKISESFKENLDTFFIKIDLKAYASLKLKNSNALQELYLFVINLKTKLENSSAVIEKLDAGQTTIVSFQKLETLKKVSGYDYSEVRKIKAKLLSAFEQINATDPNLKATLSFVKGKNTSYAYVPAISFEMRPITEDERHQNRAEIFSHALQDAMVEFFSKENNIKTEFNDEEILRFQSWAANKKKDFKQKAKIYASVYNRMFKFPIDEHHSFATQFAEDGSITISF